ncbi:MAG: hypothetical protein ABJC79_15220 [Acidimicrobiia bacterium]
MVEIGTAGSPWRAAAVAAGAALVAESEGAHAFWYPDGTVDSGGLSGSEWRAAAGSLARIVPDPGDLADPIVSAVVASMVARRMRIGVLGWNPGTDATRAARTVATLADVAPGRTILACAAAAEVLAGLAKVVRDDLDVELAVYGDRPGPAGDLGWGWVGVGHDPEGLIRTAHDAGVTGSIGIHLRVVAHADESVARRALDAPLLQAMDLRAERAGVVVGPPAAIDTAMDEYVAAGATRIVLDNLLALGAPDQLEAAQAALRGSIRRARLRHRTASDVADPGRSR